MFILATFLRIFIPTPMALSTDDLGHNHGADPTDWAVSAGEIGNWVFSVVFESFDAYGKCMDALNSDPEFQKWQLESTKAGLATRVRNNLIRKVDMA